MTSALRMRFSTFFLCDYEMYFRQLSYIFNKSIHSSSIINFITPTPSVIFSVPVVHRVLVPFYLTRKVGQTVLRPRWCHILMWKIVLSKLQIDAAIAAKPNPRAVIKLSCQQHNAAFAAPHRMCFLECGRCCNSNRSQRVNISALLWPPLDKYMSFNPRQLSLFFYD